MQKKITIALDMMSGDHGLSSALPAAITCMEKMDDIYLLLIGDQEQINNNIPPKIQKLQNKKYSVLHTNEYISMDEDILSAIRSKKNSSMRLSITAVKDKTADACVSAGNTGALMALSKIILKTISGIDRPAICTALPTKKGHMHMLDLGANIESTSDHLYQFAIMGSALVQSLEESLNPRIGLLNIGSEEFKGNETIKETFTSATAMRASSRRKYRSVRQSLASSTHARVSWRGNCSSLASRRSNKVKASAVAPAKPVISEPAASLRIFRALDLTIVSPMLT